MKSRSLIYNARILTQEHLLVVDSMAIDRGKIIAVGDNLRTSDEFKGWEQIDLRKKTVIPGLVDAHTHFYFYALSLGRVELYGVSSLDECLQRIAAFARKLGRDEWVVGEGYRPDLFPGRIEPDRYMLDKAVGGRPAFIFSYDQHSALVSSRALEIAGITRRSKDPAGGSIVRDADGEPNGLLREGPAYDPVYARIPQPRPAKIDRLYREALAVAYSRGVTGVHSFDGPAGFAYFSRLAEKGKLGLRINYYPRAEYLQDLVKTKTRYGAGDAFLRIAGVKIFADGALGSRTALCFQSYLDNKKNRGIEVTSTPEMVRIASEAATLGLPCAIHAIGDKAVANVLDALEQSPPLPPQVRHRIEHLQLVRRKDIARVKRLNIVVSMQPQQTITEIDVLRKAWGRRSADAYIYRTLLDKGIDLAFGSDVPIEPLDPLAGIAAAARRAVPGSRDVFLPDQRITAAEALFGFTAGTAVATGQEDSHGYLLPGYAADFAILSQDPTRVAPLRIYDTRVLATVLAGQVKYCAPGFSL